MLYSCLACVAAETGSAVTAGGVDDDVGGVDVMETAGRDEITACISNNLWLMLVIRPAAIRCAILYYDNYSYCYLQQKNVL